MAASAMRGKEQGSERERAGRQGSGRGGGVLAVSQAQEQARGKQEVEAGGGARAHARRHASAYWQRLRTMGSWAGPQPQCWARWALGGLQVSPGKPFSLSPFINVFYFLSLFFGFSKILNHFIKS